MPSLLINVYTCYAEQHLKYSRPFFPQEEIQKQNAADEKEHDGQPLTENIYILSTDGTKGKHFEMCASCYI